jgi:hypothetical protein
MVSVAMPNDVILCAIMHIAIMINVIAMDTKL